MDNLLNIIIRFHKVSPGNLDALSENLFCLFNQDYQDIQPIIVLQNIPDNQVAEIYSVVEEMPWGQGMDSGKLKPIVHNIIDLLGDQRSKLLNEGIKLSTGRYLAFLDFDDIIYGDAYSFLIDYLKEDETKPVICFGKIKRVEAIPFESFLYQNKKLDIYNGASKFDLFVDNFCPIHSFVIDRDRVEKEDLRLAEDITRGEDYHLLLRLTAKYQSCFKTMNKFVGEYIIRTDGSNTTDFPEYRTNKCLKKAESWEKCQKEIERLKKELTTSVLVSDLVSMNREAKSNLSMAVKMEELERIVVEQKASISRLQISEEFAFKEIRSLNQSTLAIFEHALKRNSYIRDVFVGYVDYITREEDHITFKGWAADIIDKEEAVAVALCVSGSVLSATGLNNYRSDLSKHFGISGDRIGYDMKIPCHEINDIKEVFILALLRNGKTYRIEGPEAYKAFEELQNAEAPTSQIEQTFSIKNSLS